MSAAGAIQAMLRRKTNEAWTDKPRHVTRKLVVEGGLVQKRLYDTGWSDDKKCRGCSKVGGTEKHRLYHCPCWKEDRNQIPEELGKWEQRAKTSKKDGKWERGITSHPLSDGQRKQSNLSVRRWESEKNKSWSNQVEGFRNHVTTGSLLGVSGK